MSSVKLDIEACPVCADKSGQTFLILGYPEFGYPGEFILKRCQSCGLLFNSPRLRDDLLVSLYDHNYYIFLERPRQAVERIGQLYQQTLAVLETRTTCRRILEVGSAKGYLLALLKERGWTTCGVELSQYAADFAFKYLGVRTHCGTLEDWISSPEFEPMPVVASTDVIEHVDDPDRFIRALNAALLDEGLLLIGTPNGEARGIDLYGGRWLGFNPFHINILSRNTLTLLLERNGFSVELAYTYHNLEPAAQPLASWRTRLASVLRWVGLLQKLRQAKHAVAAVMDEWTTPLPSRIKKAAQTSHVDFFQTPDGFSAAARDCRGDNLVVIARKRGLPPNRVRPALTDATSGKTFHQL